MSIWPACMCTMYMQCPQRPGEGIRYHWAGIIASVSFYVGAGT